MLVKEINKYDAIEFIQRYHYSPVLPKITKHYLGLIIDGQIMAVTTLGWGTRPFHTINKFFPGLNTDHYWEIGKQCVHPDMPKNTGTQLLSLIIRWIRDNHPHKLFLYTMADGIMGKTGIQYQAANFYYGGYFNTPIYMVGNEKCHPRSIAPLLKQNSEEVGRKLFWLTPEFMQNNNIRKIQGRMFRYIYPITKKARTLIKKSDHDWRLFNYPKDEDLIWEDITKGGRNKTLIDRPEFSYENAVMNAKNINANTPQITIMDFIDG